MDPDAETPPESTALIARPSLGISVPSPPPLNPFVNTTPPPTVLTRVRAAVTGLTLLPIRFTLTLLNLAALSLLGTVSTIGLTAESLEARPMSLWRRVVQAPMPLLFRFQLFLLGYHWIEVEGTPAPRSVAPIVVANHTSFTDPIALMSEMWPAPVSRAENADMPVVGGILKSVQTLFVNRAGTPAERLAVKEAIRRRAVDDARPRVLIFPEATCTNGRAVINLKIGAFAPMRPVQPVAVTYPRADGGFDNCWVNSGPGIGSLVLGSMLQVHNRIRVRYLPVIEPGAPPEGAEAGSTAHAADFARRTQLALAEAMGVPTTDHCLLDVILAGKALRRSYPAHAIAPGLAAFRGVLHVDKDSASAILEAFIAADEDRDGAVTAEEWTSFFAKRRPDSFSATDAAEHDEQLGRVFEMLDANEDGKLDFREFLVGLSILSGRSAADPAAVYRAAFRAIAGSSRGALDRDAFVATARRAFPESDPADAEAAFDAARGDADVVDEAAFVAYLSDRAELAEAYRTALLDITATPKADKDGKRSVPKASSSPVPPAAKPAGGAVSRRAAQVHPE